MHDGGMFTVLSTFDDTAAARRAVDALAEEGFLPQNMRIEPSPTEPAAGGLSAGRGMVSAPRHGMARIERFFERLLGRTEQAHRAGDYSRAVESGRSVVMVDTTTEVTAERAATVMQDCGAREVTERRAVETDDGASASSAGEQTLADGTVVRWRAAHVVHRRQGDPLATLERD